MLSKFLHNIQDRADFLPESLQSPYALTILTLLLAFSLNYVFGVINALSSPLSRLPGPWYAPFTTWHLNYAFARGTIWKKVEQCHKKYGSIFRLGPRHIWVSDKDAVKTVLMTLDLPKVTMYAEIARDRKQPGLFGEIRPDPHKQLKKLMSPAFTVAYIDDLEFLFSECVGDLIKSYVDKLSASESAGGNRPTVTDLMKDFHSLALDIMGECSFGKGFGQTNPKKTIEPDFDDKVWKNIPAAVFSGMSRRYQSGIQLVYIKRALRRFGIDLRFDWPKEMISAIAAVTKGRAESSENARPDLLQHVIDEGISPNRGDKMSTKEIIDQMAELMLAGSETSAGTMANLFLELMRNPDVKAKLISSLPVLSPDDPIISSKTVRTAPQFEYLEACIKEALRLHPIASEMGRRTGDSPINLMGYDLPPYTVVSVSYRYLHRNPEHWPEPLRFWPERWLESRPEDVPPPDMQAYYPFSAGKHTCIGKNFAHAEIRMVAANILSRFDVNEVQGQQIDYRQYITMQMANGSCKAYLSRRQKT
ncbi:hypothetical protein PDE_03956 [Penicillium oxalicum 114-2]|uniref:Cytochrome P450 n=1 Tax=Penicillium oxalicum (strain 114-2 / CGMCC 5302) TaxID=933388 RepID=S7ZEC5_PENO1|nr:hypothetical protein PDE_03956 [Penicillium oxalicum 114-2]